MAQDTMFRVNQLSKDFGMKTSKELIAVLEKAGVHDKKASSTLSPEEFAAFFNEITLSKQITDIDDYLAKKSRIFEGRKSAVSEKNRKEKADPEKPETETFKLGDENIEVPAWSPKQEKRETKQISFEDFTGETKADQMKKIIIKGLTEIITELYKL